MDELVAQIEDVYRRRYARFYDAVRTLAGADGARDAVQEGFARALAHRASFRGEGSLEAWIWRITLRAALELRTNAKRRMTPAPVVDGLDVERFDPVLADEQRDPELAAALRMLAPRRRLIVFLRYFADLSYADIAAVCGITEGAVSAALVQARAALQSQLTHKEAKDDGRPVIEPLPTRRGPAGCSTRLAPLDSRR